MSIIKSEHNLKRKSHRFDLRLQVIVNGKVYNANEWSISGLSLIDFDENIQMGDTVASQIIFPMKDSSIILNINLTLLRRSDGISGFQFEAVPAHIHRVLRQYLEMGLEGKLDSLDDVVGIMHSPLPDTPIQDAVTLSDMEMEKVETSFRNNSKITIIAAFAFLAVIFATFFYNTSYQIVTTGSVSGTLKPVRANHSGIVVDIVAKVGSYVKKDAPVFILKAPAPLPAENLAITRQIERLSQQQNQLDSSYRLQRKLSVNLRSIQRQYNKAKALFDDRIISMKELRHVSGQLEDAQVALAREQKNVQPYKKLTQKISADLAALKSQQTDASDYLDTIVKAPMDGKIFHSDFITGSFASEGDAVVILECDLSPNIMIKLNDSEAMKVHVGQPVLIRSPYSSHKLQGKVTAIGYQSVYGRSNAADEINRYTVPVKIELLDRSIRIPANTRVNVWIKTMNWESWLDYESLLG